MANMTKNKMIYASNKNTQGIEYGHGGFRDSADMRILWDSHRFFCGYGMGMGIKIPSPRQPWQYISHIVGNLLRCHCAKNYRNQLTFD